MKRIEKFGAVNEIDKQRLRRLRFKKLESDIGKEEGKDGVAKSEKAVKTVKKEKKKVEPKITYAGNLIIIDNNPNKFNKRFKSGKFNNFGRKRRNIGGKRNGSFKQKKLDKQINLAAKRTPGIRLKRKFRNKLVNIN